MLPILEFMAIVKPGREATFKNTIQIFDEMNISAVKRYALIEITPEETNWMQKQE